jgi:hypothetical protein
VTDYEGAPCVGKWILFEESQWEDNFYPHESEAKALCAKCPLIQKCREENDDLVGMIVAGLTPAER